MRQIRVSLSGCLRLRLQMMKPFQPRLHGLFLGLGLLAFLSAGCQTAPPNSLARHDSAQWEAEIVMFEAKDRTNPPPKGCIVFVGSSSIKRWTSLVADFPDLPVVNRGFGGSQ